MKIKIESVQFFSIQFLESVSILDFEKQLLDASNILQTVNGRIVVYFVPPEDFANSVYQMHRTNTFYNIVSRKPI